MANRYEQSTEAAGGDTSNHQQGRSNIKWGRVVEMDPELCRVRIEVEEQDGMVTYWLQLTYPKTLHDKVYFMPDVEEPHYFVFDEQGEEAPAFGAFYTPKVKPHEPDVDKVEWLFRDGSFERYHRKKHERDAEILGRYTIRAKELIIEAEEVTIKANDLKIRAGTLTINTGSPAMLNGKEIATVGAGDNDPVIPAVLVTSGQNPTGGPNVTVPDPEWDGETELKGDLGALTIKGDR